MWMCPLFETSVEEILPNINFEGDSTDLMMTQLRRMANRIQQFYDDVAPTADMDIANKSG